MGEQLVVVLRPKDGVPYAADLAAANRSLPDFKRVAGVLVWSEAFPRTASMKLQRAELVRRVVAADLPRSALKPVGAIAGC
jgi:acyl-coenzyme A synthetase/AMP-(fatty) acid ligase